MQHNRITFLFKRLSGIWLLLLPFMVSAGEVPLVTLGGEVGVAADGSIGRFRSPPYDSLSWIRADLTGEKVSEFDETKGNIMKRPFKNYSGDISGRFIEIMAFNSRGSRDVHPVFRELLAELPKLQRAGGYFCASGDVDWQKPIDRNPAGASRTMMPALWGNARMLCGLVEACRAFPDDTVLLDTAKKLGDFYVGIVPRFTDPARMAEYTNGTTYASGYMTCWFPAMEGLVKLSTLTGEKKYLDAAGTIAAFYKSLDRLPIEHSHGMLCSQVGLLLLYETTKESQYLERVEKRWDELVEGGYINPAGGIPEKCQLDKENQKGDEGCALADWLRLNLELGRVTGKSRYWDMAERTLHNHFLQNQTPSGGFGRRFFYCDQDGAYGFKGNQGEWTWCCTFHGQIGFVNLRSHLLERSAAALTCNMAVDFTIKDAAGTVVSEMLPSKAAGEVMRQHIRLEGQPAAVVRIRQPQWADAITAVAADGTALPLVAKDGFLATAKPVTDVEFIYTGGVYAENRNCVRLPNGPVAGQPFVIGYGPKIFVFEGKDTAVVPAPAWPATIEALKAQGLQPFSAGTHGKDCLFVFERARSNSISAPVVLPLRAEDLLFLDNGTVKVGINRAMGASITWLSSADYPKNLINSADPGRLIQQSYYAGISLDRKAEGQSKAWSPWSWNPIQGGSVSSWARVNEFKYLDEQTLYSETVPKLWDMFDEEAAALMRQWTGFEPEMPDVVAVRCEFISQRDDKDRWGPAVLRPQEIPACYFTRNFGTVKSYLGGGHWRNEEHPPGPPWGKATPPRQAMAFFNTNGQGVAVFSPCATQPWNFGSHGKSDRDDPSAGPCMHVAPIDRVCMGPKSTYRFRYWLILGTEAQIAGRLDTLWENYSKERAVLTATGKNEL